jgi:hypothetical protein
MPKPILESLESRRLLAVPGTTLGVYHTPATIVSNLQAYHAAYPDTTQLIQIGSSVQNRPIYALRISDNPTLDEDEPAFFYQGQMHGNEPVGAEMTLYFISHLLENYSASPANPTQTRATQLVNDIDFFIVPTINPDGLNANSRNNANGVDLNRNFPDRFGRGTVANPTPMGFVFDNPTPHTTGRQLETRLAMQFMQDHTFVNGANFHTGALVVNYPWDANGNFFADYAAAPDDTLLRDISLTYSQPNSPMYNSSSFPQGVTNGDDWYEVYGGQQDFAYAYLGSMHVTVELSNSFRPSQSTLPTLWNNNRESMLAYAQTTHYGVRGLITRSTDGQPVYAKVAVANNAQPIISDPDVGNYHRMLMPGTYSFTFSAPGYESQTISNIVVSSKTTDATSTLRQDVQLVPLDQTKPSITNQSFAFETSAHQFSLGFSEDVGPSLASSDLTLTNLTTGQTLSSSAFSLAYSGNAATLSFASPLADGRWRLSIDDASVRDAWGNPLASDYAHEFTMLRGDATGDGQVQFADLLILAQNYSQTGKTFSQGNFDYSPDGLVDFSDLLIVAQNYGTQLLVAPKPGGSSRQGRVAESVLA